MPDPGKSTRFLLEIYSFFVFRMCKTNFVKKKRVFFDFRQVLVCFLPFFPFRKTQTGNKIGNKRFVRSSNG